MNPKVDFYFSKENKWYKELVQLRKIALSTGLTEALKWGCPCYTLGKSNIVLIHDFKDYCALLFFKGALLQDESGILVQPSKNVQASRQIRFTGLKQVTGMQSTLKAYIYQAVEVEKAGMKVTLKKTEDYAVPEEFEHQLKKKPALKKAFTALTPGRQRGYLLYFAAAKQSATRVSRIEKSIPAIMAGKGLND
ncbi:MAG: YdeI/OmpD-associated family protein [Ferruginibacter sp.]